MKNKKDIIKTTLKQSQNDLRNTFLNPPQSGNLIDLFKRPNFYIKLLDKEVKKVK